MKAILVVNCEHAEYVVNAIAGAFIRRLVFGSNLLPSNFLIPVVRLCLEQEVAPICVVEREDLADITREVDCLTVFPQGNRLGIRCRGEVVVHEPTDKIDDRDLAVSKVVDLLRDRKLVGAPSLSG